MVEKSQKASSFVSKSVRPGFLTRKKKNNGEKTTRGGVENAIDSLDSFENNAEKEIDQSEHDLASMRDEENNAGGLYTGEGVDNKDETKQKGKSFFKKKGPMSLILGLILGTGGLLGGAQMMQPFSLIEQFRETFNSMQTSVNMRSNAFFDMQMDSGRVKNPIKGRLFRSDTFKVTNKQRQKLAQQGIEYDGDFEGTGTRVLKFDDGTGEIRIVAADDNTARILSDMDLKHFSADYNSEAVSFKNLYESNADFFNGYNKGSLTWRGAIANWFNSVTVKFLESNIITRNMFQDFKKKVADSESGNTRTVALEIIAKGTDEIKEGGVAVSTVEEKTETDADGNTHPTGVYELGETEESASGVVKRSDFDSVDDVENKLNKMADDYSGGSVLGTAQKVANYACLGLNFLGGVSLLVSASEALQIINLVTSYFEAIDKAKAGNGEDSPINDLMNALNENKVNEHVELNVFGLAAAEPTYTTGSAMQSSGIVALYGSGNTTRVNPNDPSVKSFNFTSSIKRVLGGIGVSMTAFEGCSFAKLAANAVSAVQSGIEIAACIAGIVGSVFTFGATSTACSGLVSDVLVGIAVSASAAVLIGGIISAITPVVANLLMRDLISGIGGEDLGNALTSGANMYLGSTHRSNGGSLSNRTGYTNFALAQQQVIAENARYERSQRSPFDMTSKYTFMGSLMTQMMSLLSTNSVMGAVMSTSAVVSSSIATLSPTASAYDISKTLMPDEEYADVCPYLASIGAVGDAYCNPYSITDVSTINTDPADVIDVLSDNFLDEVNEDGNVIIRANSDLAKYIVFCDNRDSAWGIADQNIMNTVENWAQINTDSAFANSALNGLVGGVPVIGDIIDVVQNGQGLANIGYIGGESCVAGNTLEYSASPGWDKARYYQRFIEDQSLAESMGLIGEDGNGKSAVTAFLDEYYKEHPLDNSYEGILARKSGLSKETVVALLDTLDYWTYIADYDASVRYAFGAPVVEVENRILFDDNNIAADNVYIVILDNILYADVRNRSFAV